MTNPKIKIERVSKLFGPDPQAALALLDTAATKAEIMEKLHQELCALDDEDERDSPLRDVEGPFALILRIFGVAAYVGLTVLDALLLPLIFVMMSAAWSSDPEKRKQLKERKRSIRRVLKQGRQSMKALSGGRNPYRLKGPEPPPALPPPRRGRRGRRGRGRRR